MRRFIHLGSVAVLFMTERIRVRNVFLNSLIHVFHFSWIVALWIGMERDGSIANYVYLAPLLVIALALEMVRWNYIGRRVVHLRGEYLAAVEIASTNREFLAFSWYVPFPNPPFKLIERYTLQRSDWNRVSTASEIFFTFWLCSEMSAVFAGVLVLSIFLFYPGLPDPFGLGGVFAVRYLFWLFEFGLLGKIIAVGFYLLLVGFLKKEK